MAKEFGDPAAVSLRRASSIQQSSPLNGQRRQATAPAPHELQDTPPGVKAFFTLLVLCVLAAFFTPPAIKLSLMLACVLAFPLIRSGYRPAPTSRDDYINRNLPIPIGCIAIGLSFAGPSVLGVLFSCLAIYGGCAYAHHRVESRKYPDTVGGPGIPGQPIPTPRQESGSGRMDAYIAAEFGYAENGTPLSDLHVSPRTRYALAQGLVQLGTADRLAQLPAKYTIFNGLDVVGTGLSIDHLVHSPRGIVALDTRIWTQLPDIQDGVLVSRTHSRQVDDLLRSSMYLNRAPEALFLVITGSGAQAIPRQPLWITHYMDWRTGETLPTHTPVALVRSAQIPAAVKKVLISADDSPGPAQELLTPRIQLAQFPEK